MTALMIEHVGKSYGDKTVLDDVHVDVGEGELVSLLGPSGCGKTTTLNIVAGFVAPDRGRVLLAGADISKAPPYRRDTAVVFQNYALFPHKKVFDNVAYGLHARKMPKAQITERVDQTLGRLNIADLADRYPSQLSGGQQQRVAVARAVAVHPKVLLMDEPLSNLDAKLRAEIRLELRALQRTLDQTILFVTHDQEEALSISDRLAVLNAGRVEQYGSPVEVFEHPETVFVADFMGVENIFAGTSDGARWRSESGLVLPSPAGEASENVGLRPSSIRVDLADADRDADRDADHDGGSDEITDAAARLLVTVDQRVYLGDSVRYQLRHRASGTPLVAVCPRDATAEIKPGETAVATLPVADLLPLRSTAGPEGGGGPA